MKSIAKFTAFSLVFVLLGFSFGCGNSSWDTLEFSPSDEAQNTLTPGVQGQLGKLLKDDFGTPANPKAPEGSGLDQAKLNRGAELYRINCMHCHGVNGDGNGPTAPFLYPRPRDYRPGLFKFTSTTGQAKPTRDDLVRIIRDGANYTSMPSFELYGDQFIEDVTEYVQLLSMRGQLEGIAVVLADEDYEGEATIGDDDWEDYQDSYSSEAEDIYSSWADAGDEIVTPLTDRVPYTKESIERGKKLFLTKEASCQSCHAEDGTGNVPQELPNDSWGFSQKAADLTKGIYRGGGRPVDLYRRIYAGVKGAAMAGFGGKLDPDPKKDSDKIWDLVNYVYSMAERKGDS